MPAWLAYTAGNAYTIQLLGFAWGFTPYVSAIQGYNGITSLGGYAGWRWDTDVTCPSGLKLGAQLFTGGVSCGAVARSATVNYVCAADGLTQLTLVAEPTTCAYVFTFAVNCARNTYLPGSLCIPPSPSTSASPSSTGSITMSVTPTASLSFGTSASASPSATASNTPSVSSTNSPTSSATPTATFGPAPEWMRYLRARPQVWSNNGFGYRFNPWSSLSQTNLAAGTVFSLGTYAGWAPLVEDATCASGLRYTEQLYTGGTPCGATPRSTTVRFTCAASAQLFVNPVVAEPTVCAYVVNMAIDCTGNAGTLCLEPTPSPTPSGTGSSSTTATGTPSPSTTGTGTPSPSGTSSGTPAPGVTPSGTSSNSPSSSNTPSASITPSATGTPTTSPLSPHPYLARVSASNIFLGLTELLVFSTTGRLLSANAAGAANSLTSVNGANAAANGGDLCANPYGGAVVCALAESTNALGGQAYTSVFPGGTAGATRVATVTFVNNIAFPTRITGGGGRLELVRPNGSVVAARALTARDVSTYSFEPSEAPVYPAADDAFATSAAARFAHARYVRVTGVPGRPLTFRELIVLDADMVNVALRKPVTASAQAAGYTAEMGNNGLMDVPVDQFTGDVTVSTITPGVAPVWEVDLGAVYDVRGLVLFNRFQQATAAVGNNLVGATVTFRNYFGDDLVGSVTLNGMGVQSYTVAYAAPTPSSTPSVTPTNSATASLSQGTSPTQTSTATESPTVRGDAAV